MLARLATFSYRRRRLVLLSWLVLLVGITVASKSFGGGWMTDMTLPDTDASRAATAIQRGFPTRSGDSVTAVVATPHGAADAAAVGAFADALRRTSGVASVDPPVASRDGTVEVVPFNFAEKGLLTKDAATRVQSLASVSTHDGVRVELSGDIFNTGADGGHESAGILIAIVVLLVAFGSVVAMGLPIVTALFGIGVGMAGVHLWAAFVPTPNFTVQVASMIGIGVGIDYALFIVTRYREALEHNEPEAAVVEAITTAGRAVLFAGSVVVISLLGMILMRLDFVGGLAVGSSTAVAVSVAAALTLLPAMLGFAGRTVDRLSVHRRKGSTAAGPHPTETLWHRWSRLLQRHPWPAAVAGLAILLVLSVPAAGMRLGFSDAGNDPTTQTTRRAYDLVATGFGPGTNGPLIVVAEMHNPAAVAQLGAVASVLRTEPGVATVFPPVVNEGQDTGLVRVLPTTAPQSAETVRLVHHLRDDLLPRFGGHEMSLHVGGSTAAGIDYSSVVGSRLPVFIAAVLVLSFLLLMAVFRSILVPLKAVIMNVLSISAAYGVMVAVFQWGWAKDLIGIGQGGPIEPWAPMMLFAIVFGLSMDYEVFLLSRMREEHQRTGDNSTAVVEGLAGTARVITAAAAIMVAVFGAFVLGDIRAIKLIGLGLAVAVLVDATVVRCVLVPATMELLGERNWWLPKWLDRITPHLDIESGSPDADDVTEEADELLAVA